MPMATESPMDETDQNCLFVANLPQRMTNEELAMSLLTIFKPFGAIISVKASRDQRGRPFGFVEYASGEAAGSALACGPCLCLDSRRIRVEPAKKQRKLCIKYGLKEGEALEMALATMRSSLQTHVSDEDFKLSLQSDGDTAEHEFLGTNAESEPQQQLIAAVIKFEEREKAKRAYEAWKEHHPEWTLAWINTDRTAMGSNVRSSGLVQLVPAPDGSIIVPASPIYQQLASPRLTSPLASLFTNGSQFEGSTSPLPVTTSSYPFPRYTPTFEEEHFYSNENCALVNSLERLALASTITADMSSTLPEMPSSLTEWIGRTLFVGRLNGQAVTLQMLRDHFIVYEPLAFIRLYNRGAIGVDGVPMDAYAFIRFAEGETVERAIREEHGRVWLGQAIKCEHARPVALAIMLGSAGNVIRGRNGMASGEMIEQRQQQSPTPIQYQHPQPWTVYCPGYIPIKEPPTNYRFTNSANPNPNGNWFRASKSVKPLTE